MKQRTGVLCVIREGVTGTVGLAGEADRGSCRRIRHVPRSCPSILPMRMSGARMPCASYEERTSGRRVSLSTLAGPCLDDPR